MPLPTIPLMMVVGLAVVTLPVAVAPDISVGAVARLLPPVGAYFFLVKFRVASGWIAGPLAAMVTVQSAIALSQFLLGHSLGWHWLGERYLDPTWSGISVVMAGDERYLRGYGLSTHPNLLGGIIATSLLLMAGHYLGGRREDPISELPRWGRDGPAASPPTAAGAGSRGRRSRERGSGAYLGVGRALVRLGGIPRDAWWAPAIGLGVAGLLATFSRSAWLGLAVGAALMLVLMGDGLRRDVRRRRRVFYLAVTVSAVMALFVAGWWPLLLPRLGLVTQGVEIRAVEERAMLLNAAAILLVERPLLGVGLGGFGYALRDMAPEAVAAYPVYQAVHNVPLLAAVELGLVGGVAWLVAIATPWLLLIRHRWRVAASPWLATLSGALAALTIVSLFDYYPWYALEVAVLHWALLGWWVHEWGRCRPAARSALEVPPWPS